MNDKPYLDQSEKEALKYLTGGEPPSLKELLSEEALVNVSLSSANPEDNASSNFYFFSFVLTRGVILTNSFVL